MKHLVTVVRQVRVQTNIKPDIFIYSLHCYNRMNYIIVFTLFRSLTVHFWLNGYKKGR